LVVWLEGVAKQEQGVFTEILKKRRLEAISLDSGEKEGGETEGEREREKEIERERERKEGRTVHT